MEVGRAATGSSAIAAAVAEILREADADIAARKPVCRASGRCCKFEQYGHRLYVTQAELIHFQSQLSIQHSASSIHNSPARSVSLRQFFAQAQPEGCPYQIDCFFKNSVKMSFPLKPAS